METSMDGPSVCNTPPVGHLTDQLGQDDYLDTLIAAVTQGKEQLENPEDGEEEDMEQESESKEDALDGEEKEEGKKEKSKKRQPKGKAKDKKRQRKDDEDEEDSESEVPDKQIKEENEDEDDMDEEKPSSSKWKKKRKYKSKKERGADHSISEEEEEDESVDSKRIKKEDEKSSKGKSTSSKGTSKKKMKKETGFDSDASSDNSSSSDSDSESSGSSSSSSSSSAASSSEMSSDSSDEDDDKKGDEKEKKVKIKTKSKEKGAGRKKKKEKDKDSGGDEKDSEKKRQKEERKKEKRRNIRSILRDDQLEAETLAAQNEEMERQRRLQELKKQMQQKVVIKPEEKDSQLKSLLQGDPSDTFYLGSDQIVAEDTAKPYAKDDVILLDSGDENKKKVLTDIIELSDDDDVVMIKSDEELEEEDDDDDDDEEDMDNVGTHINDTMNQRDEQGRVLINIGHPDTDPDVFMASQIAAVIKPHQIGGIRFLYDNVIESQSRFKTSGGFGCILAHSMGLGKTIQLIGFIDIFLRFTEARSALCIVPINTLQNWVSEFNMWLPEKPPDDDEEVMHENMTFRSFKVFVINDNHKTTLARAKILDEWTRVGGVLLMGYEMYRLLVTKKATFGPPSRRKKKNNEPIIIDIEEEDMNKKLHQGIQKALVNPGPDLIVCDEGHRIKNSLSGVALSLKNIKTKRRIVLTGYPLQNNLLEYWCMVDFVRPNYLGTKAEFCNMFERPIMNGQCVDSTPEDVKLMRYRAHVLHSLLQGFIQRRGHSVLTFSLPPKQEHVFNIRMSDIQRKLYKRFMECISDAEMGMWASYNPLKAFSTCCKIWNHPDVMWRAIQQQKSLAEDNDLDFEPDGKVNGVQSGGKRKKGRNANSNYNKRSQSQTESNSSKKLLNSNVNCCNTNVNSCGSSNNNSCSSGATMKSCGNSGTGSGSNSCGSPAMNNCVSPNMNSCAGGGGGGPGGPCSNTNPNAGMGSMNSGMNSCCNTGMNANNHMGTNNSMNTSCGSGGQMSTNSGINKLSHLDMNSCGQMGRNPNLNNCGNMDMSNCGQMNTNMDLNSCNQMDMNACGQMSCGMDMNPSGHLGNSSMNPNGHMGNSMNPNSHMNPTGHMGNSSMNPSSHSMTLGGHMGSNTMPMGGHMGTNTLDMNSHMNNNSMTMGGHIGNNSMNPSGHMSSNPMNMGGNSMNSGGHMGNSPMNMGNNPMTTSNHMSGNSMNIGGSMGNNPMSSGGHMTNSHMGGNTMNTGHMGSNHMNMAGHMGGNSMNTMNQMSTSGQMNTNSINISGGQMNTSSVNVSGPMSGGQMTNNMNPAANSVCPNSAQTSCERGIGTTGNNNKNNCCQNGGTIGSVSTATSCSKNVNICAKNTSTVNTGGTNACTQGVQANVTTDRRSDALSLDWVSEVMEDYTPGLLENGGKMVMLFSLIEESLKVGDKLLVFSQSLTTLNVIEEFLNRTAVPRPDMKEKWCKNKSYFRLDGSTSAAEREKLINQFNAPDNNRIWLFLLSTRAGCLGINLIGANRVVIFDASWNPCHDCQAVCRVYRYGQQKLSYIYRLITDNSLEKKIYDRQINKQGMSDRVVDELNPENQFTRQQVDSLLHYVDQDLPHVQMKGIEQCTDDVMKTVLLTHGKWLSKEPFTHESLLLDQKSLRLTKKEKQLAKQGYVMEKKMNLSYSRQNYSVYYSKPGGQATYYTANAQWPNNYQGERPIASVKPIISTPVPMPLSQVNFPLNQMLRSTMPGQQVKVVRPGVSVHQIVTTTDIMLPGSNNNSSYPDVIPAGQQIHVIKTPRGVYIRTNKGKIFAVRSKPVGNSAGTQISTSTSTSTSASTMSDFVLASPSTTTVGVGTNTSVGKGSTIITTTTTPTIITVTKSGSNTTTPSSKGSGAPQLTFLDDLSGTQVTSDNNNASTNTTTTTTTTNDNNNSDNSSTTTITTTNSNSGNTTTSGSTNSAYPEYLNYLRSLKQPFQPNYPLLGNNIGGGGGGTGSSGNNYGNQLLSPHMMQSTPSQGTFPSSSPSSRQLTSQPLPAHPPLPPKPISMQKDNDIYIISDDEGKVDSEPDMIGSISSSGVGNAAGSNNRLTSLLPQTTSPLELSSLLGDSPLQSMVTPVSSLSNISPSPLSQVLQTSSSVPGNPVTEPPNLTTFSSVPPQAPQLHHHQQLQSTLPASITSSGLSTPPSNLSLSPSNFGSSLSNLPPPPQPQQQSLYNMPNYNNYGYMLPQSMMMSNNASSSTGNSSYHPLSNNSSVMNQPLMNNNHMGNNPSGTNLPASGGGGNPTDPSLTSLQQVHSSSSLLSPPDHHPHSLHQQLSEPNEMAKQQPNIGLGPSSILTLPSLSMSPDLTHPASSQI